MARAKKRKRNTGSAAASPKQGEEQKKSAPAAETSADEELEAKSDDAEEAEDEESESEDEVAEVAASADDDEEEASDSDDDEAADDDDEPVAEDEDDEEDYEDEEDEEEPVAAAPAAAKKPAGRKRGTVRVRVRRQDDQGGDGYWETFDVEDQGNMNVISCLMAIQCNPVTIEGRETTPVVWDQACLEEVCGSCTMVINGRVRQSCSALIDKIKGETTDGVITLEPMRKFPVVRDLWVDRQRMFEGLKKVKAWVPIDGTHDLGPGPKVSPEQQQVNYVMSTCMTCGCCLDACPQVTPPAKGSEGDHEPQYFIGAAAISQARLFNANPTGKMNASERIEALMEDGGLHECGNAQNCVEVCPKEIPLTTSIAEMGRQITGHLIKSVLKD